MSEFFDLNEFGSTQNNAVLKKPPLAVTGASGGLVLLAMVMFAVDSQLGYGLAVLAMLGNSLASFLDQKARADFNYAMIDWYRPLTLFMKILTFFVAAGHIAVLAIESAR